MSSKRPAWLCSAPHLQPQGSQAVHSKSQPPAPKEGSEETFSVLHGGGLFFPYTGSQFPYQIPLITPYQAMKIQFLTSYLPLSAFCSLGHPDLRAFALDYLPGKAGLCHLGFNSAVTAPQFSLTTWCYLLAHHLTQSENMYFQLNT